jgi:putative transcriptional regulator
MGERRMSIADLSRETGIERGPITRLYHESAKKLDCEVLSQLCEYFNVSLDELLEYRPDQ